MLTLPITEESKQEEWKTIITMAKNNGYPVGIINDLRTKLTSKKHQQHPPTTPYNKRKQVTFNYYSPMIRREQPTLYSNNCPKNRIIPTQAEYIN